MPGFEYIGDISAGFYAFRGDTWKHPLHRPIHSKWPQSSETWTSCKSPFSQDMQAYEKALHDAEDRSNLEQLRASLDSYYADWENQVRPISRLGTENDKAYKTATDLLESPIRRDPETHSNHANVELGSGEKDVRRSGGCFQDGALLRLVSGGYRGGPG